MSETSTISKIRIVEKPFNPPWPDFGLVQRGFCQNVEAYSIGHKTKFRGEPIARESLLQQTLRVVRASDVDLEFRTTLSLVSNLLMFSAFLAILSFTLPPH